jgi:hypothetical protein
VTASRSGCLYKGLQKSSHLYSPKVVKRRPEEGLDAIKILEINSFKHPASDDPTGLPESRMNEQTDCGFQRTLP